MQKVAGTKRVPWSRSAPELKLKEIKQSAEEVAQDTFRQLSTQGWCLWRCKLLNGEVIVVVRDELVEGIPAGYPVYTSGELLELLDVDDSMVRLIHEAKKKGGASIAG